MNISPNTPKNIKIGLVVLLILGAWVFLIKLGSISRKPVSK